MILAMLFIKIVFLANILASAISIHVRNTQPILVKLRPKSLPCYEETRGASMVTGKLISHLNRHQANRKQITERVYEEILKNNSPASLEESQTGLYDDNGITSTMTAERDSRPMERPPLSDTIQTHGSSNTIVSDLSKARHLNPSRKSAKRNVTSAAFVENDTNEQGNKNKGTRAREQEQGNKSKGVGHQEHIGSSNEGHVKDDDKFDTVKSVDAENGSVAESTSKVRNSVRRYAIENRQSLILASGLIGKRNVFSRGLKFRPFTLLIERLIERHQRMVKARRLLLAFWMKQQRKGPNRS